jgi:hypothetical protein
MKRLILLFLITNMTTATLTGQVMMMFSSDSLVNITSPLDLDSLFYWFAADVGVTDSLGGAIANNEGVGTWNDLSGNGHHVTQSTNGARPVWKATGGPGSKPAIQFDGTNDFLASAAHWWGSDDLTVIVVMKFANATRNAVEIIVAREAVTDTRQFLWYADAATAYRGTQRAYQASTPTVLNRQTITTSNWKHTTWKLHSWSNIGDGSMTLFSDGVSVSLTDNVTTGDGTIDDLSQEFQIGAQRLPTANSFLQGSISEIIVTADDLTTAERTAIENYLNRKYDLY